VGVVEAFLDLYIFADKYSVDQLRDDLMSALVGYCSAWAWWPDIYIRTVNHAYANLPSSSHFIRFLVSVAVYFWTPPKSLTEVEALKQLDPMFTFDLMMAHGLKTQLAQVFPEDDAEAKIFKDSCVFHEHRCSRRAAANVWVAQHLSSRDLRMPASKQLDAIRCMIVK
jgi:hypothetical protein